MIPTTDPSAAREPPERHAPTGSAAPAACNLSWITQSLAIGGSFAPGLVPHLGRSLGIDAVVDLRSEACDDAALLGAHGIAFLHLPTCDLRAVSQPMLDLGVAFASERLGAGGRVLLHCEHGIGRSALLALCVLVERGMSPLGALRLAKERRPVLSPSPEQYEAWAAWTRRHGMAAPDFDAFRAVAYRHLAA
ncbi:protein-tyrosine phosphatase family protein [Propylenella binzhouense]|uniref:Protein phosphatase n=1 Tax=Propylenella binzhouense TaxID=2555902 RepID=A0A964T1K8_9HYPH|nr:dual specificity protein phosphatase family protein [Propylenella binzhouense]MYZ46696.1 protein phosphatase [Propylenella binzhouense]